MEHNIKKALTLLLLIFTCLALYYSYILFFYSDRWFANSYNPRVRMDSWQPQTIPGDIKDRKGRVLATTLTENRKNPKTDKSQTFYYRSYLGGKKEASSIAHVVGFNDYNYGRLGAEALQIRYLMGYNNPIYEKIYQKLFLPEETGNTLYLSIDAELQKFIDKNLSKYKGSVVVMNADTGEILAMVSHPTFNPNNLKDTVKGDVLVNRATDGLYVPGSIIKVIIAASGLENMENILDDTFECTGSIQAGSQTISCSREQAHGKINLAQALSVSCNGYFIDLGINLGKEKILKTAKSFGFNQDFIFPDTKLAVSRLPLKKSNISHEDIAYSSIGQGEMQVTPLHMAMLASAVANDGVMMEPKLVYSVENRKGRTLKTLTPKAFKRSMKSENAKVIQNMMEDVVANGTGKAAAIKGYSVAGKTGTAEIADRKEGTEIKNNAWFIGYVPGKDSKIAISIVLEDLPSGQTGGKIAAPIAGKILRKAIQLGY